MDSKTPKASAVVDGAGPLVVDQLGEQIELTDMASVLNAQERHARGHLGFHRLAALFPMMTKAETVALMDSISANGQRELIVLHEGAILDGRNRYLACTKLGIEPKFKVLPANVDPLRYVIDINLHRRHLDDDQRRMVAGRIANLPKGRPADDNNLSNGQISRAEAADLMSVDIQGVDRAKVVLTRGVPELQEAVDQRNATVRAAADIAKLPKEEQREVLQKLAADPNARRALKKVAKEVRAEEQKARHTSRQKKIEEIAERNPALPVGRLFGFVLIDVPRHHNAYSDETGSERSPENHFLTMTFDDLIDFPIDNFAGPDCIIGYWSTAASLVDDIEILAEWGFIALRPRNSTGEIIKVDGKPLDPLRPIGQGSYGSHQIWRKQRAGRQTGMGRWFRDQHEVLIVARRGNAPAPVPGTQDESVFDAPIGDHSEKPHDHVRGWIDRCWPDLSKVEVFARGTAPAGWTFWGNQADNQPHNREGAPDDHSAMPTEQPVDQHEGIPSFLQRGHPDYEIGNVEVRK